MDSVLFPQAQKIAALNGANRRYCPFHSHWPFLHNLRGSRHCRACAGNLFAMFVTQNRKKTQFEPT
jgi:hypothetical protein